MRQNISLFVLVCPTIQINASRCVKNVSTTAGNEDAMLFVRTVGWYDYKSTLVLNGNEQEHYQHDHGMIPWLCHHGVHDPYGTNASAVFHATEELKNKINILTDRVHNLEDALQQLQNQVLPDNPHPLLSEKLLTISREFEGDDKNAKMNDRKSSGEDRSSQEVDDETPEFGDGEEVGDIKEALGTLALHSDGRSRFYGATATVEVRFKFITCSLSFLALTQKYCRV